MDTPLCVLGVFRGDDRQRTRYEKKGIIRIHHGLERVSFGNAVSVDNRGR
jgi:hypothetical protein